ncbi:hypothetical protein BC830DRAFT_770662 [Chytriomyces sp. MP71]|nr:hypothetical protein BC830DRAFT_770662 [Chytriomyces sp. MP71]
MYSQTKFAIFLALANCAHASFAAPGLGQPCNATTAGSDEPACSAGLTCVLHATAPGSDQATADTGVCMIVATKGEACGGDVLFAPVCAVPLFCTFQNEMTVPGNQGVCTEYGAVAAPGSVVKDVPRSGAVAWVISSVSVLFAATFF